MQLTPSQQYKFTKDIFEEIIRLPLSLAFNNQDPEYNEVAVVTNIQEDGKIKDNY